MNDTFLETERGSGRRLGTCFLLWLLGAGFVLSVVMAYLAGANFKVTDPDRLRNAAEVFGSIPEGEVRSQALRYVASELNRHFFSVYTYAHALIFGAAFVVFFASRQRSKIVFFGLVFSVALSVLYFVYFLPTLTEMGRQIDFMPRDPDPPEVKAFYAIHRVNIVMEMIKLVWIPVMSGVLMRTGR